MTVRPRWGRVSLVQPTASWALAIGFLAVASVSAQQRAEQVLAQARTAMDAGGTLKSIASLSVDASVRRVVESPAGLELTRDLRLEFLLPDSYRRTESTSIGTVSRAITMAVTNEGFVYDDGGVAAMVGRNPAAPGPLRDQMTLDLRREAFRLLTIWLLSAPPAHPTRIEYAGVAEAPDGKADVVDVQGEPAGASIRLFLDAGSHRLLMARYSQETTDPQQVKAIRNRAMDEARKDPQNIRRILAAAAEAVEKLPKNAIPVEMRFADYRKFGSVTLPSRIVVEVEGQGQEEWTVLSFKPNVSLKPQHFTTK
jgi:hypothetical protein